jgi:membrane-bound metal-dependent hydrolase YbcI (DUF457 family)
MDPLTHVILSLAGGYLLACGLNLKVEYYTVPLLAVASTLIDVDHLLPVRNITDTLILHNIATVVLATLILRLFSGWNNAVILFIMLVGHLLLDMNTGIYGIPLFYPLSTGTYLIPKGWEIWFLDDSRLTFVSRTGIALSLYFGLIGLTVFMDKIRKKRRLLNAFSS